MCLLGTPPQYGGGSNNIKSIFLLWIVRRWEVPGSLLASWSWGTQTPSSKMFSCTSGVASIIKIHNGCLIANSHFTFQKGGWGKGRKQACPSVLRTHPGNPIQDITSQFTQESIPWLYQACRMQPSLDGHLTDYNVRASFSKEGRQNTGGLLCHFMLALYGHRYSASSRESEPFFLPEETTVPGIVLTSQSCKTAHLSQLGKVCSFLFVSLTMEIFPASAVYHIGFLWSWRYSTRAYSLCLINNVKWLFCWLPFWIFWTCFN